MESPIPTQVSRAHRQHDVLCDYQFWSEHGRHISQQPELNLMIAVLEDALDCYLRHAGTAKIKEAEIFTETESWFFDRDNEALFSFESVCSHLGLDPRYIRNGLLLFRKAQRCGEKVENKV